MIMQAADLLQGNTRPSDADIAKHMSNLCRCGTYVRIRKAIHRAALKARERARRFGHGLIIYENGKMVEKLPDKDA